MRLSKISLQNFRNYTKISISSDADLVLMLGENAAGKANFLESVYFLSRLKSFRAPDQLFIKYGESYLNISGALSEEKLEVIVQISPLLKRQFKINGQKIQRGFW